MFSVNDYRIQHIFFYSKKQRSHKNDLIQS